MLMDSKKNKYKDRVLDTFNFKRPDAIPIDYEADEKINISLCKYFGVKDLDNLLKRLGIDFRWVELKWLGENSKNKSGHYIDPFGIPRAGVGTFGHVVENPFKDVKTIKDIRKYKWPSPDDFDYDVLDRDFDKYEEYAVISGAWGHLLTIAFDLFGMERFLVMMYEDPDMAHYILDRICEVFEGMAQRMFSKTRKNMDIYCINDDYGFQHGPMMSLEMWRKFIKPRLKRLCSVAKRNDSLVMQHSCGSVKIFIPDFIEIGVDILNPVQVTASDMDPEELSKSFKHKIGFHGSIDTQRLLILGSIDDVKREVEKMLVIAKKYRGWALAPNQLIMPETPVENVIALYDTLNEYRWY